MNFFWSFFMIYIWNYIRIYFLSTEYLPTLLQRGSGRRQWIQLRIFYLLIISWINMMKFNAIRCENEQWNEIWRKIKERRIENEEIIKEINEKIQKKSDCERKLFNRLKTGCWRSVIETNFELFSIYLLYFSQCFFFWFIFRFFNIFIVVIFKNNLHFFI